ncbi:MFS transporter [Hoyosella rhizosphaerae]|uniref:MFS transporter n=1 Tax=Hoyosella rhizosphaerae TaxID=1755582 RepID=UPI001E563E1C|nr:MFS transporter [Hoyosella rhizosphaerae]
MGGGSSSVVENGPATRVLGWAIVVLSALQLMVVLDGTVVNLALARLQDDLGLTDSGRTWVITSYALAFGGLMLLGGRLGDSFGRKRMFMFGVALFTFASLIAGVATTDSILIFARGLQGVGAAVASPTAFALVATTFAAGPVRNQAFAIFAMMTALGSVSGLLVGGALTEVSWRWIFLINIPIGLLILAMSRRALPESQGPRRSLDVPGAILATLGCSALVYGLTQGAEGGWDSNLVVGAIVTGFLVLGIFLLVERNADNPLLPFVLFRDRDRVATFAAIAIAGAITMCMAVFVALFVQEILGFSPLQAGLSFVPFAFALGIAAQIAATLAVKFQPRWLVATGGVLMTIGLGWAAQMDQSSTYLVDLLPPILVVGAGVGTAVVPLTLCAVAGVHSTEIGPLTAIALVAQTLGGALGLAVVGAFATSRTRYLGGISGPVSDMTDAQVVFLGQGYMFAIAIAAALAALLTVVVALWMRFTPEHVAQARAAQDAAPVI